MNALLEKLKNPRLVTIAIFPLVAIALLTVFRFTHFPEYMALIQEDGVLEYTQFLGYFLAGITLALAGIFQLRTGRRKDLTALCLLGACALIIVAFEEISWGQRLENLKTPEYFTQHNVQNELTIHNLKTVQPLIHWAYLILGSTLAIGKPVAQLIVERLPLVQPKQRRYLTRLLRTFAPDPVLAWYFLPVSAIYAILMFYKPYGVILKTGVPVMIGKDQELGETFLALGILLHSLAVFYDLHRSLLKHWSFRKRHLLILPKMSY